MGWKKHFYPVVILERYLDSFGHMNNAVYLDLFEQARWDWITAGGFGLEKIKASQMGPVLLEVNLKFKRELKLRTKIIIESQIANYETKIAEIHQNMIGEDGTLHCAAVLTMGFFNTQTRKLIQPPEEWLIAVGKI